MVSGKIKILRDAVLNIFSNGKFKLSYVVEAADWSIKSDGRYITSSLNNQNLIKSRVTTSYLGLRNQTIHFGSVNTYLKEKSFRKVHKSNKVVLTWFHFVPSDKRNKNILKAQDNLRFIHTSASKTKKDLINLGIKPEKIVVIPLGVDLDLFKPASLRKKQELKKTIGVPNDKVIIGSFQKDGIGWGKGDKPKLIKGPDIFVKSVGMLARKYPVFVILTGPARGYIESELAKRSIPFKSIGYLKDLCQIAQYYQVLDLYFIASRIEGGPKQILEAWASGVPVVSTRVGMVPDISRDRENILLAEIESIEEIADKAEKIIRDKVLRKKIIKNGLSAVKNYSWGKIARRYYEEIYSNLI